MRRRRNALAAEVLQRANPVEIGGDGVVVADHALHDRRGAQVHQLRAIHFRRRPARVLRGVQRHGAAEAGGRGDAGDRPRHLKSLREKSTTAPKRSAAMYMTAYAAVEAR